jgi:hypothetical protein
MINNYTNKTKSEAEHEKQLNAVVLSASEFIAFALFRLWHPKNIGRRRTFSQESVKTMQQRSIAIISPEGTLDWYPAFVMAVHKLIRASGLPTPIIFIALLYIARLRKFIPTSAVLFIGSVSVSTENSHCQEEWHLLLAGLMIAQKQHSDSRYANNAWAKMANLPLESINSLEIDFLQAVRWDLHVRDDQYTRWVVAMQILGKEHVLVLRAFAMEEQEIVKLEAQLGRRPDLVDEIRSIRRTRTIS